MIQAEYIKNSVRIFPLTIDDAAWLSKVALKAYFDHYRHLWFDAGEWYAEKCFNVEQLRLELSDENALFFGVEDDKEPLGFLKINQNYPLSKNRCQSDVLQLETFDSEEIENALELERIYLTKQGQGRGIGRMLVDYTFTIGQELQKEVVWLKAMDTSLEAIAFYEKMGFKTCATMRLTFERMKPILRGMVAMKKNAPFTEVNEAAI
ncbi:MAG: GNAT family N-acetyltransferase [Saprospiraceae bacterium]|nr:GNAT family N-acetyltransferase [Saprospiraceae bacterium]